MPIRKYPVLKNSFEAYKAYLNLKLWYRDGVKGVKVSKYGFEKRKDKRKFEKFVKKEIGFPLLVYSLSRNPDMWVGEMEYDDGFQEWYGKILSIHRTFKSDLERLGMPLREAVIVRNGQMPLIFKKGLLLESISLLDSQLHLCQYWRNQGFGQNMLHDRALKAIERAERFISYDDERIKGIIKEYHRKCQ